MALKDVILVINPGSTTTKVALFTEHASAAEEVIEHDLATFNTLPTLNDQFQVRRDAIRRFLDRFQVSHLNIIAVVGRGGPLKPLRGGTYRVTEAMLEPLRACTFSDHPSNLGALLAADLADEFRVSAFVVDPVTVDEFIPEARISGVPKIERKSRFHALNIRAVSRKIAREIGIPFHDANFVVAHLGGGISIAALRQGKTIDVNNGLLGQGPFSPNRAGALPIGDVVELCFNGSHSREEVLKKLAKQSGLLAYLGTADVREVMHRISDGDEHARLIFQAMLYQIAKEIGAMAVALKAERIDGIILTGGISSSSDIVSWLTEWVSFLAPVFTVPGENEMEALAMGAFRVVKGEEAALDYETVAPV